MTHRLSSAVWLELHYAVCRSEYERLAAMAGFAAGERLLDAGCGAGSYAHALRRHIGTAGVLVGCDILESNVSRALGRSGPAGYDEVVRAGLNDLPFPDASFDGIWCANVLQLLDDASLRQALSEMRRVLRPGGRVAVKDVDMLLWRVHPLDPLLLPRLMQASLRSEAASVETRGALRGRALRRALEEAGFEAAGQVTTLIERWAPLDSGAKSMYAEWLRFFAGIAEERGASAADVAAWRAAAGESGSPGIVEDPAFYACEGQVLALARKPASRSS